MTSTQLPLYLVDELRVWISQRKTGNLQINFFEGAITNYNRVESVKPDKQR